MSASEWARELQPILVSHSLSAHRELLRPHQSTLLILWSVAVPHRGTPEASPLLKYPAWRSRSGEQRGSVADAGDIRDPSITCAKSVAALLQDRHAVSVLK